MTTTSAGSGRAAAHSGNASGSTATALLPCLAAGGKRLRPRFALLGASALGAVDVREHLPLAAYMELIHVGTLIHDDVVDRADTRRGVNATAVDYGNRVSVLAGDYLFAWIFKNVTAGYPAPIPHILSSALAESRRCATSVCTSASRSKCWTTCST